LGGKDGSLELGLIESELMLQGAISSLVHGLSNEIRDDTGNDGGVLVDGENVVTLNHDCIETSLVVLVEGLGFVDLANLSQGLEEFISSTSLLGLEE